MIFSGYVPSSGIARYMVILFLVFLGNLHTVLQRGRSSLHSHQQCKRLTFDPHPLLHLFGDFSIMAILTAVK